jgi:hypothetical protein
MNKSSIGILDPAAGLTRPDSRSVHGYFQIWHAFFQELPTNGGGEISLSHLAAAARLRTERRQSPRNDARHPWPSALRFARVLVPSMILQPVHRRKKE